MEYRAPFLMTFGVTLALCLACAVTDVDPDKAAIEKSAEPPQALPIRNTRIEVTEISRWSTPDSHADYYVAGTDCRENDIHWECRSYQSYHSFKQADLPDAWHRIPDSKTWDDLLQSDNIQTFLKMKTPEVDRKNKPIPRRGGSSHVSLSWDGGGRSVDKRDASEEIHALLAELNKATREMEIIQPRFELQMGNVAHVGLYELAWLDSDTALKLEKCEKADTRIKMLRAGKDLGTKTLGLREAGIWEVGGFRIKIESHYCGRQNYVALTPIKKSP